MGGFGFRASPVYTFGSPRVGNEAFSAQFTREAQLKDVFPSAWRVVHFKDPVPRIVPRMVPFMFTHVGVEVWYPTENEDRYRVFDRYNTEDPTCSASFTVSDCMTSTDHLTYFRL